MNWTFFLIAAVVLVLLWFMKGSGQVPVETASQYLREGALLVDVRTPSEYNSGHLADAKNVPLDDVEATIPSLAKDKSQAILLHCQSGMRSGMAQKKLRAIGYANTFNLGSYTRALGIVTKSESKLG